jgi:hypothetical protein
MRLDRLRGVADPAAALIARLAALQANTRMDLAHYCGAFACIMFFIRHRLNWFGDHEVVAEVE